MLFFFLIEFCKDCIIHGLVRNSSSFLLSFLKVIRYIRYKFNAFKFFQSRLRIQDLVTGIFEKKSGKKINCGRWFENVDVTLPDSISSKEVEFEKILSIKVDVLEIFVGKI